MSLQDISLSIIIVSGPIILFMLIWSTIILLLNVIFWSSFENILSQYILSLLISFEVILFEVIVLLDNSFVIILLNSAFKLKHTSELNWIFLLCDKLETPVNVISEHLIPLLLISIP